MITEVIVIRLDDAGAISYEIRDQNDQYLADEPTFEAAIEAAQQIAIIKDIEYVKIQVATEAI